MPYLTFREHRPRILKADKSRNCKLNSVICGLFYLKKRVTQAGSMREKPGEGLTEGLRRMMPAQSS